MLARGLEQQRQGEPEAALATFSDCIVRHTAFVPALLARGNLRASRNDYSSALTDFSAALKLVPQSGQIHTAVGMLQLRSNLTGLAEAAFLNAIRFDSGQADAYNNLAWLTSERKTRAGLNDALAWAKRAVALHPKRPTYLDTLATVYGARGELDAAIAAQEKAVALTAQIGQKIGKAYSIEEEAPQRIASMANYSQNALSSVDGASESEGTLALGQIKVSARVTVKFELN